MNSEGEEETLEEAVALTGASLQVCVLLWPLFYFLTKSALLTTPHQLKCTDENTRNIHVGHEYSTRAVEKVE